MGMAYKTSAKTLQEQARRDRASERGRQLAEKIPAKRGTMGKDRALQISNNVSEEYLDHAETDFATKGELCETIIWLRNQYDAELRRKDAALDDIFDLAAQARLYPTPKF